MKKMLLVIIFFVDALIFIKLIYTNILYAMLYILLNVILMVYVVKRHYKIDIINICKFINYIKCNNVRKLILTDEKYMEKMNIKTFDGSGGTTHPCILKINGKLNNYLYYMVHTPYDNHNTELENPSLCVSNDGINFIVPKNINDPLLPIIKRTSRKYATYYNDNFMVYHNGKVQIWYRYTDEDKNVKPSKLKNKIYRIVTSDGINFSEPELMIDDDGIWYLSPSIVKIGTIFYLYYFDKDFKMYYKTSKDLYNWSLQKGVKINNYNGNMWHGEVKKFGNKLYLLFLSKDFKLYWCNTDILSPAKFDYCRKMNFYYYDNCNIYGNLHPYKSTFLIDNNYIYLYIPFVVNRFKFLKKRTKWTMTYTKISKNNFEKIIINDEV